MENNVIYVLITAIIGVIGSIVTFFLNFRQSKEIERLKVELEKKREVDNLKFKFLFDFHTERIVESLKCIQSYVQVVQEIKTEIRELLKETHHEGQEYGLSQIKDLKQRINKEYSSSAFVFNKVDKSGHAHSLKNLILDLLELIQKEGFSPNTITEQRITMISEKQSIFQKETETEIYSLLETINIM